MSDDPLIGRQLANFQIEHMIGRGGMATVYYGQDVKLERPVAIKIIDARHQDNPAYAERFIREAKSVATWRHEHIVHIYYADDEDDLYYFVMEYIDGLDLHQLITQYAEGDKLMPHAEVLRIGQAVAQALDYAHEQSVIHRDVKPSNIMVAGDDRVILTDFGLALDVEQGSLGEVFGSSRYIAPEQAQRSADAVPQSDIYALGVVLYEMLTGSVPFDDPSPTAVALQHISNLPPPPRTINPNLSPQIDAVLMKSLEKAPGDRYQTGQELLDALGEAFQIDQPATDTEQPGEPLAFPARRSELKTGDETLPIKSQVSQPSPTDSTGDLIGQQLDEYRLEDLLGHGGMARVYRALDVRLQRYVAIKVIDTPFRTESEYTMRFEREAQAIAQLEHPHIVRLYRYGETEGLLYIVMRYIEGVDLDFVLTSYAEENEFITPQDAARIIREICLALDEAHSKGVIHRDVKPSNIMLDKDGRAILADFGLALMVELGTQGEIFGSPHYIAPEQAISSAGAVPQSDLYGLGVILYQMFTNQLPFDAKRPTDVAMQHMSQPPSPPREIRTEISPEIEAVILKVLAKEPGERYPNGAALADALDQALQSMPTLSTEASSDLPLKTSIADRVAVELAEHPLPPIPAAIATPSSKQIESDPPLSSPDEQTESEAVEDSSPPTPTEDASPFSKQSEPESAPPPSPPDEQIEPDEVENSLPPIPAEVATSTSPEAQVQPAPASTPSPPTPALPPAPTQVKSTANSGPLLFVAGGIGFIIAIGIVLVILLAVIVYLLWFGTV